jgi:hypothetical protein
MGFIVHFRTSPLCASAATPGFHLASEDAYDHLTAGGR